MKRGLSVVTIIAVLVLRHQVRAQNLAPVTEGGRTFWVNADAPKTPAPKPAAAAGTTSHYSNLGYWSSKQHRWVPVPRLSSPTMKAARQAAQEVTGYSANTAGLKKKGRCRNAPRGQGQAEPK